MINGNPSLKPQLKEILESAYNQATLDAFKETGLEIETFPEICPWTIEQISQDEFYPD